MKTPEEIIKSEMGISINAGDMTPMDYGECKKCIQTAQREAWNAALELAAKEVIVIHNNCGDHHCNCEFAEVDKQSILNLKKP